jgi:hypothetical protein
MRKLQFKLHHTVNIKRNDLNLTKKVKNLNFMDLYKDKDHTMDYQAWEKFLNDLINQDPLLGLLDNQHKKKVKFLCLL